ncbi:MAG: hypothetical protein HUU47_07235 [Bacteroidetes bacterium]|nr:hypothetical protein [Bacteroidota bacterium]
MKSINILILVFTLFFLSCKDSYNGPGPKEPTCFEFNLTDTVENMRGIVRIIDTTTYIENYIDESTKQKLYPCALNPIFKKEGFPIEYSGYIRKKEGKALEYIELNACNAILNETIITNYYCWIRSKDSTLIPKNEINGVLNNYKVENNKIKLLITYNGCTKGRTTFLTIYKSKQTLGMVKNYCYITSPYEPCSTEYKLWYELDVAGYKGEWFVINDGKNTYEIEIPE